MPEHQGTCKPEEKVLWTVTARVYSPLTYDRLKAMLEEYLLDIQQEQSKLKTKRKK